MHPCSLFSATDAFIIIFAVFHHLVMIEQLAGFRKFIGRRDLVITFGAVSPERGFSQADLAIFAMSEAVV